MMLSPGTRVGPYDIIEPLAAGGMGQVYRAHDTRLGRHVAIKVIADPLQARPDLRERFKVEASAIAALSHPHICRLYDVGQHGDVDYLVMELVEGESLADRMRKGRLPLQQALQIAREIAGALDAAHRQGIVHRDVKPSNVMLTRTGAKLLDFGLARLKPIDRASLSAASTVAPAGSPITEVGMALGTWQYMAPEQVRGEPTDARVDIFALGALTFEMVSGRRAFEGATPRDLTMAILESEPPSLQTLVPAAPPALARIVATCLAKAPDNRWQSAGDVGRALDTLATVAPPSRSQRPWLSYAGWGVAALIAIAAAAMPVSRTPAADEPARVRSSVLLGEAIIYHYAPMDMSRDGRTLVFTGRTPGGPVQLFRRAMDGTAAAPLDGTNGAMYPFLSPNGAWVGFFAGGQLKKVSLGGGAAIALCAAAMDYGGHWGDNDQIVFSAGEESELLVVPAAGGTPSVLVKRLPSDEGEDYRFPQWLPGGNKVVFTVGTGPEESARIVGMDLATGSRTVLVQGSATARYAPTGHLVYVKQGKLYAARLDVARLAITGTPLEVAQGVAEDTEGSPYFAVSNAGDVVFVPGSLPSWRMVLVDLAGRIQAIGPENLRPIHPRFSPEGRRIAFEGADAKNNIWVHDLDRGTTTRVTFGRYLFPLWTPDGRLTMMRRTKGEYRVVRRSADGAGADEVLLADKERLLPNAWTPDGGTLLVGRRDGARGSDLLAVTPGGGRPVPLLDSAFDETVARISGNGRWLAYKSNENGRADVYVRDLQGSGTRVQVSQYGAHSLVWSPDGRQLYFSGRREDGTSALWAVTISDGTDLRVGIARPLFPLTGIDTSSSFDVAPDGKRFVMTPWPPELNTRRIELIQRAIAAQRGQ